MDLIGLGVKRSLARSSEMMQPEVPKDRTEQG